MSVEQTRATIVSSIWKAIAQSKIDLSSIPADQQEALVRAIADGMLITLDDFLDEIEVKQPPEDEKKEVDEYAEEVLWKGRPFLSLVERITITNERIKLVHGLVGRNMENYELIRIQDIDLRQNLGERMLGIGDIKILGHDPSNPEIILRNLRKPDEIYEILRRAWLDARKRHGLQFREYM